MNLRILKKLSAIAAPLLALLDDHRDPFKAELFANYTSTCRHDRKHWEHHPSVHDQPLRDRTVVFRPRHGTGWIHLTEPCHPLRGTCMVGGMSTGEESEWNEETAWDSLRDIVRWSFGKPDDDGEWKPTRRLKNPAQILAAARELVAVRSASDKQPSQ